MGERNKRREGLVKGAPTAQGSFCLSVTECHAGHLPLPMLELESGAAQSHIEEKASSSGELGCFDYRPDDRRLPDRVRGESGPLGQTRLIRGQGLFIASATIWVLIPIPTQIAQARTARSFHKVSRSQRAIGSGKALRKDAQKWAIAQAANVRFGSLADIRERIRDVRFAPEKRTYSASRSMSALCHEETSPQHAAAALQTARRRALRNGALKRTRVLQGLNSNRVISISIRDAE